MLRPISVYVIEEGEKKECNIVAFFGNAASSKLYVIIESPSDKQNNTVIPFWVNDEDEEQEPQFLEDDEDKNIIAKYCEKELEGKNISFSCSENIKFYASLDLKYIKYQEAVHRAQLQEMLFKKDSLDVDKIIGQIDKRIVEMGLEEINENEPKSIIEFIKYCINVNKYDLWLNKKIEEAKNKISKFTNLDNLLYVFNQLKALQSLIELLSKPIKEKRTIEDALVNLIKVVDEETLDLNAILNNGSIATYFSESERKKMYGEIVLRANEKFDTKTVNAVANYFYKENDFNKALKLFIKLSEICDSKKDEVNIVELYNSIGCCYVGLMMFNDAYKAFRKAVEINSDYAVAYNNWAYTLITECDIIPKDSIRETKLREALRRINQAIQHKNDDVSFYSNKACIEYELNSFQAVIEDYDDATKISSNYKDIETILKLKIYSKIELYYLKMETLTFNDFIDDLETIYNNTTGSNKYLFQALEVYNKIKSDVNNADEICLKLMVFEFIVDKLMSALAIRNLSQDIYYYTNLSNLHRLLADDEFKQPIFCASHMNDPNEGQELLRAFLQKTDNKELIQDLFNKTENVTTDRKRQKLHAEFTFLKAFTENEDSLPMWIHYGDEGKGCCIKVNPRFFSNFENDSDTEEKNLGSKPFNDEYRLYRVVYLKDGKLSVDIDDDIKKTYENFIDLFKDLCLQYVGYTYQLKNAIRSSISKIISNIIYLFKNTDYQYEREMRIVLRRSLADFEREDIDIQTTSPTECNPIPKVFIFAKKPLEIEEIILGPKLVETDNIIPYITMRLLKMNNYQDEQINITKSSIEYR